MRPDPASLPLLAALHRRVFREPQVRAVLDDAFERLAAEVRGRADPPHAASVIPIELFTDGLARDLAMQVRLCRAFLLRRGARMAAPEVHGNSVQRLVSYRGRGRICQGTPTDAKIRAVAPGHLTPRPIRSPQRDDAHTVPLEDCWDIVPAGVWHYPEAGAKADWATVTFHSASEEEIVDELWEGE